MEFTTKQKVIGIVLIIILISISIYVYNIRFKNNINEENITDNNEQESIIDEFFEDEKSAKEKNLIIVHITGAVNKSGIVKLSEGSRIYEAIEKADGSTDQADLEKINLAYELEDGQKIYIPYIGEEMEENDKYEYITSDYGNNKNIIQETNKGGSNKVNINTANQTELETLPGIGTATAAKIIDYRNKNGKFQNIEDIQKVNGIGDAKFENIKENICIK